MARKSKLSFITISIVFVAIINIAAAKGWGGSLDQTGMNMPTDTVQPQSTVSIATRRYKNPDPVGNNIEQNSQAPPGPPYSLDLHLIPIPQLPITLLWADLA